MNVKEKASVYVFNQGRLLVFHHKDHPEVGYQVPSGTVRALESAQAAAVRELEEETSISVSEDRLLPMTTYHHDMRPFREEIQVRHSFSLELTGVQREAWSHLEMHPDTDDA